MGNSSSNRNSSNVETQQIAITNPRRNQATQLNVSAGSIVLATAKDEKAKKKGNRVILIRVDKDNMSAPDISIIKELDLPNYSASKKKQVKFFDFKGLMASVFTCFDPDDENELQLRYIDTYAKWLKSHNVSGVLVNGITGEGPALNIEERKLNTETWWRAAIKYDLVLMVQVGGAPLPDVIELARHADTLGVHAVMCLPELLYKPRNIKELVLYCKQVAKHCSARPFFYCHYPMFTNVNLDMVEFCDIADQYITNFFGIEHGSVDINMGARCLNEGRVILLSKSTMMASGMLLGFDSLLLAIISIRPDLVWAIYDAMQKGDILLAGQLQIELNALTLFETRDKDTLGWMRAMKGWFNRELLRRHIDGFFGGPARALF